MAAAGKLDVVRALYDAVNARDLERFLRLADRHVEFDSLVTEAERTSYRGHDGVRRWWEAFPAAFPGLRFELVEQVSAGRETIVVKVRVHAPVQGVGVEQSFWQAFRIRDGRGVWWATFRSEREAREAARRRDACE